MISIAKQAEKAKAVGSNERALLLLRRALEFGNKALSIQGRRISKQLRETVTKGVASGQSLYHRELMAQMPEDDRELLMSVLKSWTDMGIDAHPLEKMIGMFDIAKGRLDDEAKALSIIYDGDHVPAPLRDIMKLFISGDATPQETEQQLEECSAKLKKWIPELFPAS